MGPADREAVFQAIALIKSARDLTLIVIEHDVSLVFAFCQTIAVLHQGKVVAVGPPDAIRNDARVQRVYLGRNAHAQP